MKDELTDGDLLNSRDWTKWWNKVKKKIKVNPHFHLKEKSVAYRQEPVSFADEVIDRFEDAEDFEHRLNIANELLATDANKQVSAEKYEEVASYFRQQSVLNIKNNPGAVSESLIMLYRIYKHIKKAGDKDALKKLDEKIASTDIVSQAFGEIILPENQKLFFDEVMNTYKDNWVSFAKDICLTPLTKVHDIIISELIRLKNVDVINSIISTLIEHYRDYPDVFVWMSKNLLSDSWKIDGLQWNIEDVFANLFYLVSHLNRQIKTVQEPAEYQKLLKQILNLLFSKRKPYFKDYFMERKKAGEDVSRLWDIFTENKYIPSKYQEQVFAEIRAMEKTIMS